MSSRINRTRTITGLVSNAVAGTRSTHAHGLGSAFGFSRRPEFAIAQAEAADADGAIGADVVRVVSIDDTNVVVRASAASVPFTLIVGY